MLLVEDEPDQAAILEAVLRHEGLDVVVAASGEQALDIHQRTPADVLVTDLNLPGMTGIMAMAAILSLPGLSFATVAILLALLGTAGGFFVVPVNALIQRRPAPNR